MKSKPAPPPATSRRKALAGLMEAVERAVWRAIEAGETSLFCYARPGPQPNVIVRIELHKSPDVTQVIGCWEDEKPPPLEKYFK